MFLQEVNIEYILLPIMLVMALILLPTYLRERKQGPNVTTALNRLKLISIFYAIIMFVLMLCLPVVWYKYLLTPERIKSLEEAIQFQSNIAFDLKRMREVIYWAFFMAMFWFWGVYNVLKQIVPKTDKASD